VVQAPESHKFGKVEKLPGGASTGESRLPGGAGTGESRLPGGASTGESRLPGGASTGESRRIIIVRKVLFLSGDCVYCMYYSYMLSC
jgi:hypothetical protein